MQAKYNSSNSVFLHRNDWLHNVKWWKSFLENDVYNGMTLAQLKIKYKYGSKDFQLKADYNKKRFVQAYNELVAEMGSDFGDLETPNNGTGTGSGTGSSGSGSEDTDSGDSTMKYIILGILAVGLIAVVIWKKKSKK
jgi:LPXTG-motif cell wall-anchored protein